MITSLMTVPTHQTQRGASLVEVMVSLLITGVGLLGVLSLQANGLSSSQRAVFVTEAQFIAQDMADRIMAFGSTDADVDGNSVRTGSYHDINVSKSVALTAATPCSPSDPCSAASEGIKTHDVNAWHTLLRDSSLPRARATVTWTEPMYAIRVMWDQDREGGDENVACNPNNCFTMELRLP